MMGLEQLLMLVEEALLVMGLRLLLVCHSGEEYEIGESDEDVESGRDERPRKNKLRLTEIKHEFVDMQFHSWISFCKCVIHKERNIYIICPFQLVLGLGSNC
jgi:hypothetical protein